MSRKSKHRRRVRKNRRVQQRLESERARSMGLLPPHLSWGGGDPEGVVGRNRSQRWMKLRARGGRVFSFVGTGLCVPFDFDDPLAEQSLTVALTEAYFDDSDEC